MNLKFDIETAFYLALFIFCLYMIVVIVRQGIRAYRADMKARKEYLEKNWDNDPFDLYK